MSVPQTRVLAAAILADPTGGLVRLGSVDALMVTLYFALVIGTASENEISSTGARAGAATGS